MVLCTTKWSDVKEEDGERHTKELVDVYWKEIIEHRSTVHALKNSCPSAWKVLDLIIESNREKMRALQIQKELVDDRKLIPDTEES